MGIVLILTNAEDPTAALVENELVMMGAEYCRLNTETFGSQFFIDYSLACGTSRFMITTPDRQIRDDDILSIWYRRPKAPNVSYLDNDRGASQFATAELESALNGALLSLNCLWVSHPSAIRLATHKICQLKAALFFGFEVPRTIISSNVAAIRQFYEALRSEGKKTAAKLVSKGPPIASSPDQQYCVYTSLLSDKDLLSDEALSVCPAIYQEYIEKKYELRITVVGDEAFACEIHSQAAERTRIDWRRYDLPNTPHLPHELNPVIADRCIALTRHFGLSFSAIDLIVTPDNRFVFLELNPNGQWGWIQELTWHLQIRREGPNESCCPFAAVIADST